MIVCRGLPALGAVALGDRWAAPERWPDYSAQIVTASSSKAVRSWWRAGTWVAMS